jgi:putative tryptophan/tyrosine transport system substrate-binding protein
VEGIVLHLNRRYLLKLALETAAATALSHKLLAAEPPKIGILFPGAKGPVPSIDALVKGLKALGQQDGETISIEYRFAEGKVDNLPELAKELVDQKVTVIAAVAGESLVAATKVTTTIPIVSATAGGDFVAMGLAKSWDHPGGNVTGMNLVATDAGAARVEILKKILPHMKQLAVLANKAYPGNDELFAVMEATAKKQDVKVLTFDVSKPDDLEGAITAAKRDGADAVTSLQGPFFFFQRKLCAEVALKNKMPLALGEALAAEAGALLQVNPDVPGCAERAATFVDRILKGAKPADLAIERYNQFQIVFNLKTAGELGINIAPEVSEIGKIVQ